VLGSSATAQKKFLNVFSLFAGRRHHQLVLVMTIRYVARIIARRFAVFLRLLLSLLR
jgi:hypothetical protein